MGYLAALTRGGSPSVDLMVGTADGRKTVTIQVKTMIDASFKKGGRVVGWNWRVGRKALELCGESVFYAFVDLRGCSGEPSAAMRRPDVYVVPADVVRCNLATFPHGSSEPKDVWINIIENKDDITEELRGLWAENGKWHEAWHFIADRLGRPSVD